ncbi:MAG: GNAT family N-acetyltransferase [Magnetospirillum sp.]|nr:GNAT family N-acetyltransferase [Magnetospirillum sp.]
MRDGNGRRSIAVLNRIADIASAEWDACAGTDTPFVTHAFLEALESSGSAAAKTGWLPRHLVVRDSGGKVVGCAPLYLKSHSLGEYVFDWGWADAYERAGGSYYPKLQCAVPFTPVTGPRLMVRAGEAPEPVVQALTGGLLALARDMAVSSLHVTFPTGAEALRLERAGFLLRLGYQYHWENRGYGSFDDFLAALSSRKRKQVRRERDAVAAGGLRLTTLAGGEVTARHWDAFHRLYRATTGRKWGEAYLTRPFFERLSASALGDRVVLMMAYDGGTPIAAAFSMLGGDTLFGRNWGAAGEVPFLHFELCYYRALDFAIAHGLKRVEAGAQGEHKVSRGYRPAATWSAHWIADPAFRTRIAHFLADERPLVAEDMAEQAAAGPYRRDTPYSSSME